ncbi:MAG: phage scaffolding protein [Candidatus Aminicenantales bacterium]
MATQDDAAKKAADDAAQKAAGGDKGDAGDPPAVDPTIAALMKDPDAVQKLLESKRGANDEAKKLRLKLEAKEKAEKEASDKALADQGEFKKLAEQEKANSAALKTSFTKRLVDLELRIEAQAAGCVDADAVIALAAREGIAVSEDLSQVTGAKEAVAALIKAKPYLFAKGGEGDPPAPGAQPPAPRGGFAPAGDEKIDPRDRIARGLATTKK